VSADYKEIDGALVVTPKERLDTTNAQTVEQEVMEKIDETTTKVVFDFKQTEYVSSSGLRILLKVAKTMRKNGGAVALCCANRHIKDVLELSGFKSFFVIAKNLHKAIAEL
jgi:anti-anti-sigma factor